MSESLNIQSEIFKLLNYEYPGFKRKINISDYVVPTVSSSTIRINRNVNSNLLHFKLNTGITGNIKINVIGESTNNYKVYDIYGEEISTLSSGYYDSLICDGYFVILNKDGLSESTLANYNLIGEVIDNMINSNNIIIDGGKFDGILNNSVTENKLSPGLRYKINNPPSNIPDKSITMIKLEDSVENKIKTIDDNIRLVTSEGMIPNDITKANSNSTILRSLLINNSINEINIPSGTFHINRISVPITNKLIKGVSGNTVLQTSDTEAIVLEDSTNVTFDSIKFVSTNVSTSSAVVSTNNREVNNIKFTKCTFNTLGNNGIKFINEGTKYTKDIIFEKCDFVNVGRMGIEIQNHNDTTVVNRYENIKISKCAFKNIGTTGSNGMAISMTGYGRLVFISECTFETCNTIGVELIGTNNSIVEKCTFIGNITSSSEGRYSPISITNARPFENITISECTSIGNLGRINIYNGKNLIFENNNFEPVSALYLRDVSGSKLTKNSVKSNGNYSLMLDNCTNNEVYNNTFDSRTSTTTFSILRLYGANSTRNKVYSNQLSKNDGGVFLDSTNGATGNYVGLNYFNNNVNDGGGGSSIAINTVSEEKLTPELRNKINQLVSDLSALTTRVDNM